MASRRAERKRDFRPNPRAVIAAACLTAFAVGSSPAHAHIFVFHFQRAGRAPCGPGRGWTVECFYAIPAANASNLLTAETYVSKLKPDFTFRADTLDWPAGPAANDLDVNFPTMGDFLNGHISELSDPNALNLPFDHFLLRATGYLSTRIEESSLRWGVPPPVWVELGLATFDGGRIRFENTTIFRILVPPPPLGFFTENAICERPGVYRVTVTFFQKYDPTGAAGAERAGFELYMCFPDGFPTPGGAGLTCDFGSSRAPPPRVVYNLGDVLPLVTADFETDGDLDLADFAILQKCFTGPNWPGGIGFGACDTFDLDLDRDVDMDDVNQIVPRWTGPVVCP